MLNLNKNFKEATSDNDFQYSEVDEINNLNRTVTIDNLQSGMIYTFGVLLINNDGNYNDEDFIKVNYTTLCHSKYNNTVKDLISLIFLFISHLLNENYQYKDTHRLAMLNLTY